MLSVSNGLHHESPVLRPEVGLRSGEGSRQRVLITCVPQTKTKTNRPSDKRRRKEKKKKACCYFVNFSYSADWCVLHWGGGGAAGCRMSGYKVVVGEKMGVFCSLCSVAVHSGTL